MKYLLLIGTLLLAACYTPTEPMSPYAGTWTRVIGDAALPTAITFNEATCDLTYGARTVAVPYTPNSPVLYYGDKFTFWQPSGDTLRGYDDQISTNRSYVFTYIKQ